MVGGTALHGVLPPDVCNVSAVLGAIYDSLRSLISDVCYL
jgi:hypothetical protein